MTIILFLSSEQSQNFPLTTNSLLNILEALAPFKHFSKLREFIEVKLPPGFPIEIGECFSF